jgi:hypothetical protein
LRDSYTSARDAQHTARAHSLTWRCVAMRLALVRGSHMRRPGGIHTMKNQHWTRFASLALALAMPLGFLAPGCVSSPSDDTSTMGQNVSCQDTARRRGGDDGSGHDGSDDRGHDGSGHDGSDDHGRDGVDDGATFSNGDCSELRRGGGRDDGSGHDQGDDHGGGHGGGGGGRHGGGGDDGPGHH